MALIAASTGPTPVPASRISDPLTMILTLAVGMAWFPLTMVNSFSFTFGSFWIDRTISAIV